MWSLLRRFSPTTLANISSASVSFPHGASGMILTRSYGLLSRFAETLQKEMKKSEVIQDTLKKLRETEEVKQAREGREKAQHYFEETREKAKTFSKETLEKSKEFSKEVHEKWEPLHQHMRETTGKLSHSEQMERARKLASEVTHKVTGSAVGKKVITGVEHAYDSVGRRIDTWTAEQEEQFPYKREIISENEEGEMEEGETPKNVDSETLALTVTKENKSKWNRFRERVETSGNPVLRFGFKVGQGLGSAVEYVSDKVFGETEMSLVMRDIAQREPEFNLEDFLRYLRKKMIPEVLSAYLRGDLETMKEYSAEQAYHSLFTIVKQRQFEGIQMDQRILNVRNLQLVAAKYNLDVPMLVVSFETQQIHCFRDRTGKIIEGAEDDIRNNMYVWALRHDDKSRTPWWIVTELFMQGSQYYI